MITRKHTPGPWHDAVAIAYELYWLAPYTVAERFGITVTEMRAIHRRCRKWRKRLRKAA